MKMIYAGLSTDPKAIPENFRYNCTLNPACQRKFYIPLSDIGQLDLYFDLPFMPSTYSLTIVDFCNGSEFPLISALYVVSEHPNGFYGVFSNMSAVFVPKMYFIKGEFSNGTDTAVFFSNDFTSVDCYGLKKIEGCYNNPEIGTYAYDINGIYYGFPISSNVLGEKKWRYYHTAFVRLGKIANTKHTLTVSLFNYKRVYQANTSKIYNFSSEAVPTFYKDIIAGVITRGNITIDSAPYRVSDTVDLAPDSEDNQLWPMNIPLTDVTMSYFSCKDTECRTIAADITCCDPIVNSSAAVIVAADGGSNSNGGGVPLQQCLSYTIDGIDDTEFDYTDCITSNVNTTQIGKYQTHVICSITYPVGTNIRVTKNGLC